MVTRYLITHAMIACYHIIIMIRKTTKKEVKRIRSLRKSNATNIPKGLYFIGFDGCAYVADSLKEMTQYNKQLKDRLTAQITLL